ncbi:MAG: MFS transporter [Anaerolineales bacterium]|nr:MFS transporter [Anaerolineales bacterium]
MHEPPTPQRLLIPLGIGTVISLLSDATLYTVLPNPEISAQVGVSLGMVGVLLAANRATRILVNGPVGALYENLPRRNLMVLSLILGTLSSVLYVVGSGPAIFLCGRILWGIAWSILWIGGNTMVLDIATRKNRGRLSSQFQTWFFIGIATSSFMGGLFTDLFGFKGGLMLSTILIGLVALLWFFFLPETRPRDRLLQNRPEPAKQPKKTVWKDVAIISLPLFAVRLVFAGVLASTSILWLEDLVGERAKFAGMSLPLATLTGAFIAIQAAIGIFGARTAGYLSDLTGRRWLVMSMGIFIGVVGIFTMTLDILPLALSGGLIAAVANGSVQTLVPAIAGDHSKGKNHSRSLGLIYASGDTGSTLGPLIALNLLNSRILPLDDIFRGCSIFLSLVLALSLYNSYLSRQRRQRKN